MSKQEKRKNKKNQKAWWQPAMEIFVQVAAWIVFPVIVSLFLGNWLDEKNQTSPKYTLIFVGTAFIITNIGLIRLTLQASKKINNQQLDKKDGE